MPIVGIKWKQEKYLFLMDYGIEVNKIEIGQDISSKLHKGHPKIANKPPKCHPT